MQITENLIYLLSVAASIGGSYILLNYKTNQHDKKIDAGFRKLDKLYDDHQVQQERLTKLETVIDQINVNNIATRNELETKFVTKIEHDLYSKKIDSELNRLTEQLTRLTDKIDKLYDAMIRQTDTLQQKRTS